MLIALNAALLNANANCETAKHHGSLVTEQNFASWRL